jgi:sec-independent protein translocase protein TatA
MGISWQELIVVLLIVLVLFGPKRLPEIGASLGRGIRGFKDSLNGRDQLHSSVSQAATRDAQQVAQPVAEPVPVEVVETTPPSEQR